MNTKLLGLCVALLLAMVGLTVVSGGPSNAGVPISQTAKLRQERPVSGRFTARYNNYGEAVKYKTQDCPNKPPGGNPVCYRTWYRVARGTLNTKITTYRVEDDNRKYEYFLVDVDSSLSSQSGSSQLGDATIRISNLDSVVDYTDSKSLSADAEECKDYPVSVGAGWGVASAGIEVGAVRFCDDTASFKRATSGTAGVYTARRLPKIRNLNASRLVKVLKKNGPPRFQITIAVPVDECTSVGSGSKSKLCHSFHNKIKTYTYKIGSNK